MDERNKEDNNIKENICPLRSYSLIIFVLTISSFGFCIANIFDLVKFYQKSIDGSFYVYQYPYFKLNSFQGQCNENSLKYTNFTSGNFSIFFFPTTDNIKEITLFKINGVMINNIILLSLYGILVLFFLLEFLSIFLKFDKPWVFHIFYYFFLYAYCLYSTQILIEYKDCLENDMGPLFFFYLKSVDYVILSIIQTHQVMIE